MAELNRRGGVLGVFITTLALIPPACGESGQAKQCLASGGSQVCAWRDGAVQVSTEGLEPGSSFQYAATVGSGQPIESQPDLRVGEDGSVPGVLGILSATGGKVTLDITAVAAGGEPLVGRVTVA